MAREIAEWPAGETTPGSDVSGQHQGEIVWITTRGPYARG